MPPRIIPVRPWFRAKVRLTLQDHVWQRAVVNRPGSLTVPVTLHPEDLNLIRVTVVRGGSETMNAP